MFSPYSTSGFYHASVSKGLLGGLALTSVALNVPLQAYRHFFVCTYPSVFHRHEVWRVLTSQLVFLDPKDLLCALVLIYHFRIFERRYGSHKFASCVLACTGISCVLQLVVMYVCHKLDISLDPMPVGPYGLVFSLFVPYFNDIPRVAITHFWGIPFTGKSLTYIIGLQMASGTLESAFLASCGVIAGLIYRHNIVKVQSILQVPAWIAGACRTTIGKLLETPPPEGSNDPIGATIEIQRQQQMERLEQQLAWAQIQNPDRQHGFNPVLGGLFGHRNPAPAPRPPPQDEPVPGPSHENNLNHTQPPVSEDQVQRLVEMGFSHDSVLEALRVTNNDINLATNILLQET